MEGGRPARGKRKRTTSPSHGASVGPKQATLARFFSISSSSSSSKTSTTTTSSSSVLHNKPNNKSSCASASFSKSIAADDVVVVGDENDNHKRARTAAPSSIQEEAEDLLLTPPSDHSASSTPIPAATFSATTSSIDEKEEGGLDAYTKQLLETVERAGGTSGWEPLFDGHEVIVRNPLSRQQGPPRAHHHHLADRRRRVTSGGLRAFSDYNADHFLTREQKGEDEEKQTVVEKATQQMSNSSSRFGSFGSFNVGKRTGKQKEEGNEGRRRILGRTAYFAQHTPKAAEWSWKEEEKEVAPSPLLSDEQRRVLELVLAGRSLFFTGSAGTGKSFLLKEIVTQLRQKYNRRRNRGYDEEEGGTVHVTASTGIAACNIGGITVHAFAGVGLAKQDKEQLVEKVRKSRWVRDRWLDAKVLVIDEISMLEGSFFDKIEYIARRTRRSAFWRYASSTVR
ncbi:DNA helicase [Balamuthia mandrillaris]